MSWDSDDDCPNCGLSNYEYNDPFYPYCDEKCQVADRERRALRRLRFDMWWWNVVLPLQSRMRSRWSRLLGRAQ